MPVITPNHPLGARVRLSPSFDRDNIIGVLPYGASVEADAYLPYWWRVKIDGAISVNGVALLLAHKKPSDIFSLARLLLLMISDLNQQSEYVSVSVYICSTRKQAMPDVWRVRRCAKACATSQ